MFGIYRINATACSADSYWWSGDIANCLMVGFLSIFMWYGLKLKCSDIDSCLCDCLCCVQLVGYVQTRLFACGIDLMQRR